MLQHLTEPAGVGNTPKTIKSHCLSRPCPCPAPGAPTSSRDISGDRIPCRALGRILELHPKPCTAPKVFLAAWGCHHQLYQTLKSQPQVFHYSFLLSLLAGLETSSLAQTTSGAPALSLQEAKAEIRPGWSQRRSQIPLQLQGCGIRAFTRAMLSFAS